MYVLCTRRLLGYLSFLSLHACTAATILSNDQKQMHKKGGNENAAFKTNP
jgi:hypothetical protein